LIQFFHFIRQPFATCIDSPNPQVSGPARNLRECLWLLIKISYSGISAEVGLFSRADHLTTQPQLSSNCFLPHGSEAEGQVEIEIRQIKKQIVDGKGEFSIPLGQETDMTEKREVREQTLV
jgi:hypothetical protein